MLKSSWMKRKRSTLKIEKAGIEPLDYDARWSRYRLSLHKDDLTKHRPPLKELLQAAYQSRSA
jgi:hypothetical protein